MSRGRAFLLTLIALLVAWGGLVAVLVTGTEPVLGLDLQGGFSVVLSAPEGTDEEVLEKAKDIMERRIASLGSVQEPEIAVKGGRSIEIQLPGVTDRERALNAVGTTGQLSFRQVFDVGSVPGVSPFAEDALTSAAAERAAEQATTTTIGDEQATTTTTGEEGTATTTEGTTTTTTLADPLADVVFPPGVDPETGLTIVDDPTQEAWLLEESTGLIYHVGPALVLGADITGAQAGFQGGGSTGSFVQGWVVDPDFTSEGAQRFEDATKVLAGFPVGDPRRRFAIVLDGTVVSAPQVAAEVTPTEGLSAQAVQITIGSGTADPQREAEDLATVLRYGALPTTFQRDRVEQVSATLGADSLNAGLVAGIGGLILVALAMLAYYRALGLVAVVGLTVFGSILLVAFSLLGELQGRTLTLAGVAGIIVSIGITSDSYIVYFERIKEEVRNGRALRSSVDHAFPRAFRTILTADAVSFAMAVLLFTLAIGAVEGFALALGIATVTDVLVAYFFTRPATALLVRTRMGEGGRFTVRGAVGHPSGGAATEATT